MARQALGPATLRAVNALAAELTDRDQNLLLACSGGPDSTALAVAAVEVARRRSLPLAALVVDHGLQVGSAAVAAEAAARLVALGVSDAQAHRVVVRDRGQGPEAAAREARYAALLAAAESRDATVLVAHTLDDQAETVLLGLARGSGARSLAGMAVRSGRLLRPLLTLPRTVLRAVCEESGVQTWTDPHNADPSYARVRARTAVLPVLEDQLGPGIAAALARTARLLREDADWLDQQAAAVDVAVDQPLPVAVLTGLPPALAGRVLRRWLIAGSVPDLGLAQVESVARLVSHWHGQRWVELPGGVRVVRESDRLVLCEAGPRGRPPDQR